MKPHAIPPQHDDVQALMTRLLPERLQRLQRASGLPVVFGGAIRWEGRGPRLVISRLVGTQSDGLDGLVIEPGKGLGGKVMRDAEPGQVEVYGEDPEITHDFDTVMVDEEELSAVLAVPVIIQGLVQGVLYGASRDADAAISIRAMRAATTVAAGLQRDIEQQLAGSHEPSRPTPNPRAALADLSRLISETTDPAMRERLTRIHADLGGRIEVPKVSGSIVAAQPQGGAPTLTPREIDVLRLVGEGASNVEAAAELGLSPETVKAYLRSTLRKLGVGNRTAAAHIAQQWGLLGV